MLEVLLILVVSAALLYILYSHRYYVQWGQDGKSELITITWFSRPLARVVSQRVPHIVNAESGKTTIIVDENAANFTIRIGSDFYEVI